MKTKKGFNIIEIMITVAVISILSSVVIVSVQKARDKAKDARIINGVNQLMMLAESDARGSKNYLNFHGPGAEVAIANAADCDAAFANFSQATEARNICKQIVTDLSGTGRNLGFGTKGGNYLKLYFTAYLPGKNSVYCSGSNGKSSSTTNVDGSGCSGAWTCDGCPNNIQN